VLIPIYAAAIKLLRELGEAIDEVRFDRFARLAVVCAT
jgi:hypothetical protein